MTKTATIRRAGLKAFTTAVFLGASMAMIPSVWAQAEPEHDHLKCYEVTKDSNSNPEKKARVVVFNTFNHGTGSLCSVTTSAALFCTPAIKTFPDDPASGNDPRGGELATDMLCHKVKCDKREKETRGGSEISDQFTGGEREIQFKNSTYLC